MANAIGAALGTVGATVDTIESLDLGGRGGESEEETMKRARLSLLERTRERAICEAVKRGAVRSEVYIHSEDVVDVAYVANKVRVRVKAIGPLREASERETVAVEDNPHWPFASEEDRGKDVAAGLPSPKVEGTLFVSWFMTSTTAGCLGVRVVSHIG